MTFTNNTNNKKQEEHLFFIREYDIMILSRGQAKSADYHLHKKIIARLAI